MKDVVYVRRRPSNFGLCPPRRRGRYPVAAENLEVFPFMGFLGGGMACHWSAPKGAVQSDHRSHAAYHPALPVLAMHVHYRMEAFWAIGLCAFQEAAKACRDEDVYSGLALYNLSRWHSSTVSLHAGGNSSKMLRRYLADCTCALQRAGTPLVGPHLISPGLHNAGATVPFHLCLVALPVLFCLSLRHQPSFTPYTTLPSFSHTFFPFCKSKELRPQLRSPSPSSIKYNLSPSIPILCNLLPPWVRLPHTLTGRTETKPDPHSPFASSSTNPRFSSTRSFQLWKRDTDQRYIWESSFDNQLSSTLHRNQQTRKSPKPNKMRFSITRPLAALASIAALVSPVFGEQKLASQALKTCQANSGFSASLFNVVYTPESGRANVDIVAVSTIQGKIIFDVAISAYGYEIITAKVDPCSSGLLGLCPMTAGKIPLNFTLPVDKNAVAQIPSIAYNFPDIDAKVRVRINMTDGDEAGQTVACVEAEITNGKTVDLAGVKWATAIVATFALTSSAFVSGLGHHNAASHVAANALSLFGYFQAQAMLGLTGVPLPPAVMGWTQDFQWSMGIIKVNFMQDIFTWYQRATGGTPSMLFDSLATVSVQVQKRALDVADYGADLARRSMSYMPRTISEPMEQAMKHELLKRGNIQTDTGSYVVYGIQRAAFRAHIESTNLFMTCLIFFCVLVVITILCVAGWKGYCELAAQKGWMKHDTFLDFRNGWFTVLKGILFRITLIGFPAMTVMCMWEFTQNDSPAEMVLALFFFLGMLVTLGWAAFKVIRIARRSVVMHQNPAYILFSDPQALNKWGFLYVQFRASAYYFIVPVLGYTILKGFFVAFGQNNGTAQAVGFLIIEAAALIAATVMRPWMDRKTNWFNIAICVMNFINAIFLLMFTEVFNQPPLVTGVIGLILWITNSIFSLVYLLMLICSTIFVFFRENPDNRYQFMADDRTFFMKSQTHLTTTTELDALAATARGDKSGFKGLDLDDDAESMSSDSLRRQTELQPGMPAGGAGLHFTNAPPKSPVDPAMPLFPSEGRNTQGPQYGEKPGMNFDPRGPSPSPYGGPQGGNATLTPQYRALNNASPWQRGAGYEH
ncbi:calcium-related spray protein [Neurospora intermedia]|uniref:Calcium-related spray protein n=1 Tax=Neurospora intermedia TaxID=5142 RepID=A0ABR3CYJ4_NEUIN